MTLEDNILLHKRVSSPGAAGGRDSSVQVTQYLAPVPPSQRQLLLAAEETEYSQRSSAVWDLSNVRNGVNGSKTFEVHITMK